MTVKDQGAEITTEMAEKIDQKVEIAQTVIDHTEALVEITIMIT
jgi:hypothetical protein